MFHQQLNWFVVLVFVCSISPSRSNGTPDLSTVKQFLNVESSTEPASSEPSHQLSGVDTFSLTFLNRNGRNLKEESTAPYGSQIKLSISVGGQVGTQYDDLTLDLHEDLLSPEASFHSYHETGSRTKSIPNYAYKGIIRDKSGGPELGWVRATVVNEKEAYLYILNYLEEDLLVVEPIDAALKHSPKHPDVRRLNNLGHTMVAYRHHADASPEHKKNSNGFRKMRRLIQHHAARNIHPLSIYYKRPSKNFKPSIKDQSRNLALMPSWLRNSAGTYRGVYGRMSGTGQAGTISCPAIQQMTKMGIACDCGFYQSVTSSSASNLANDKKVVVVITNIMQIANVLYTDQINVFVQLAEVVLFSACSTGRSWDTAGDSSTDWNQKPNNIPELSGSNRGTNGCDSSRLQGTAGDYDTFLEKFRQWRINHMPAETTNGAKYGIWHALTNCFPPSGTVGQAYRGWTCSATHNVGWDNYGSGLWATFAHEVGHNFGASHTMDSGGIMSYDNAKELKFTGENPYEVCQHIQSRINSVLDGTQCYVDFGATCGNGILEPGEECDGDSCCNVGSCTFISTAHCSHEYKILKPDGTRATVVNECCSSQCKPTGTNLCHNNLGFCVSGACQLGSNKIVGGTGTWCLYSNKIPCRTDLPTSPGDPVDPCKVTCAFDSNPSCSAFTYNGVAQQFNDGAICSGSPYATCQSGTCTATTDPKSGGGGPPPPTPTLTVTAPATGTSWQAASSNTVTWTSSNVAANTALTVKLVNSGGTAVALTTQSRTNTGSYTFTLPNAATAGTYTYCVALAADANVKDCSDSFSILAAPSIDTISTSPSASTVVILGSTLTVQWTYSGAITNVKIELLRNGAVDRVISLSTSASSRSFQWNVPSSGLAVGNSIFRIKVTDASSAAVTKTSTPNFSIEAPPTLAVIVPLSNTQWIAGSAGTVTWSSTGIAGQVSIKLYRGNSLIKTLSSGIAASTGTFSVTTSQTTGLAAGTDYKVTVRDTTSGAYADSSASFQVVAAGAPPPAGVITPAIPTNAPCSAGGSACVLTWTMNFGANSPPSTVIITHSGSASGTVVASVNANAGTYSWSIPAATVGGIYFYHIASIGLTPTISSTSPSFTITAEASVSVTQPNTNTVWNKGKTVTVSWVGAEIGSSGNLDTVNVILMDSKDGSTVATLGTSVSSTASGGSKTDIVVPTNAPEGTTYIVKVISSASATLFGVSASFTIRASPTIVMISPTVDTKWARGASLPIRWNAEGVGSIRIELLDQNDAVVQTIATPWITAPGNNKFDFDVPRKAVIGTGFTIKLTSLNDALTTIKSPSFSITARPSLDVIAPLSGQAMTLMTNNAVEWLDATSTITGGNVKISLSRSGKVAHEISASTPNNRLDIWYADPSATPDVSTFEGTGYTVVVEDAVPASTPPTKLYAVMGDYPGLSKATVRNSFVTVEKTATGIKLRYSLHFIRNSNQGNVGGLHVHSGVSCQDPSIVGGHFFTGATDPWATTQWTTKENTFDIPSSGSGLPSMLEMTGKAVVVHAEDGQRIGCGILRTQAHGVSKSFSVERPTSLSVVNSSTSIVPGIPGMSYLLRWVTQGYVEKVDVKMESITTAAAAPIVLASNLMNTGSILFSVPFTAKVGDDYLFSVSSGNVAVHRGNQMTVQPTSTTSSPKINIIYPSKSLVEEGIHMDSSCRIVWEFTQPEQATHVSITLSSPLSDQEPVVLVASALNNGLWEWTPTLATSGEGTRYQLQLTPIDNQAKAMGTSSVSNEFAILSPQPSLSNIVLAASHNALTKGSADALTWTSTGVALANLQLLQCYDTLCDTFSLVQSIENNINIDAKIVPSAYTWNIPYLSPPSAGLDYALRLESSLHPNRISTVSSRFSMSDYSCDNQNTGVGCPDERRFEVTAPKASASIVKGRRLTIQWTLSGKNQNDEWIEQSVMIVLYSGSNSGDRTAVYQIASQIDNTGSFQWFVPNDATTVPIGNSYTIRVYPVDRSVTNSENSIFKYRSSCPPKSLADLNCESGVFNVVDAATDEPTLMVNVEGVGGIDGFTLEHQTSYVVYWETLQNTGLTGNEKMSIDLIKTDGSTTGETICQNQPVSGSCVWTVPTTVSSIRYPTKAYQIQASITLGDDSSTKAVTTETYRVAPVTSMNVTRPYKNLQMEKGSTYNIIFNYTGIPYAVDAYLYSGSKDERVVMSSSATASSNEQEVQCVFPFIYLGRLHNDCIRESQSTHFRGAPWCATRVDKDLNPTSRGACKPLILIKQIPRDEMTLYDEKEQPLSITTHPLHVPIDIGFFRWSPSETLLPAQGEKYHIVLSSTTDRTMTGASNTFTVLCTSYTMVVQLLAGTAPPSDVSTVQQDLATNLNVNEKMIRNITISTTNPIRVAFEINSVVKTKCPVEVYGTLLQLWSSNSGTGFLKDIDTSVEPTKTRIDKSDLLPSEENAEKAPVDYAFIVAIVITCTTLCLIMIAVAIYVYRHRQHHHSEHLKTVELHRDWKEARTVDKRVYYFNTKTGETSWTPPEDGTTIDAPNAAVNSEGHYLPPGWQEGEHDGAVFYFHDDGESTSWEFPDWIPEGWAETQQDGESGEGEEDYATLRTSMKVKHHQRNITTHVIDSNDDTWVVAEADVGQKYFFNESTGQSQWEKPDGTSVHGNEVAVAQVRNPMRPTRF